MTRQWPTTPAEGEPQEVQALLNAYDAYSFITAAADKTGLLLPGEPEREMPLGQGQYYNLLFHTEDALFRDGPVYLEKAYNGRRSTNRPLPRSTHSISSRFANGCKQMEYGSPVLLPWHTQQ